MHGLVIRAVTSEARGPGLDSSFLDQMVFHLNSGKRRWGKMDPGTINSMIIRTHVDKNIITSIAI